MTHLKAPSDEGGMNWLAPLGESWCAVPERGNIILQSKVFGTSQSFAAQKPAPLGKGSQATSSAQCAHWAPSPQGEGFGQGNDSAAVEACIGRPPVEMMQYRGRAMLAPAVLVCDAPKGSL